MPPREARLFQEQPLRLPRAHPTEPQPPTRKAEPFITPAALLRLRRREDRGLCGAGPGPGQDGEFPCYGGPRPSPPSPLIPPAQVSSQFMGGHFAGSLRLRLPSWAQL